MQIAYQLNQADLNSKTVLNAEMTESMKVRQMRWHIIRKFLVD